MSLPDDGTQQAGFGIYIHWPFCQSKCPYCDFNSHVADRIDQRAWAQAYVAELERYRRETGHRIVNTVFFGGGTPSLMDPRLVDTILMCIAENWRFARDAEITLEANPSSVEAAKFGELRGSGINRVSLGIQALDDRSLQMLGRLHSVDEALTALDIAQRNFPRVSFDLIYARQDQTPQDWEHELGRALRLGTEHLSLYQLTIEDGTAFGRRAAEGRLPGLPDDERAAEMYALTQAMTEAAGLPAYEVSNHARPGAEGRHNLIYWRGGDYLGVGPGAHGRLVLDGTRYATESHRDPARWLKAVAEGNGECLRSALSARDVALEYLLMSLRLSEGCDLRRLSMLAPRLLDMAKVRDMQELGLLWHQDDRLTATTRGRMVLNAVLAEIIAGDES